MKVEVDKSKEVMKDYATIIDEMKETKVDKLTLRDVEESFSKRFLTTRRDYSDMEKKFTNAVESFQEREKIIDSLSFYTYTHISDIMHDIMDPMFKRKLAEYESEKVKEFIKDVKDHNFLVKIKKIGDRA
jgi:hypothetical protein